MKDKIGTLSKGETKFFKYEKGDNKLLVSCYYDRKLCFFLTSRGDSSLMEKPIRKKSRFFGTNQFEPE